MKIKKKFVFFLLLILFASICRFFKIDQMPGEIYGDIVIIFQYLARIFSGKWPFDFILSPGPLYYYVISPIVLVLGESYLTLKIASGIISLLTLAVSYHFVRKLVGKKVGLLTVLIMSFSSWVLIFSRLGNSQIIIPFVTVLSFYFLYCWIETKTRSRRALSLCIFTASLGWYIYPQTFILPPLICLLIIGYICTAEKLPYSISRIRLLVVTALLFLIFLVPFLGIVRTDKDNFTKGYIGGHVFTQKSKDELLKQFQRNLINGLSMFHFRGDVVFRSNVSSLPQLDIVSGTFFILGIGTFLIRDWKKATFFGLVPLVVLVLPSLLVFNQPGEVPSASRTLGATPFVYMFIAYGMYWLCMLMKKKTTVLFASTLCGFLVGVMTFINLHRYFFLFIGGLPNHNTSFGRIIADNIDRYASNSHIYMTSCCWGEWGQPEAMGVYYALSKKHRDEKNFHVAPFKTCSGIPKDKPLYIIINPAEPDVIKHIASCYPAYPIYQHFAPDGNIVFVSLHVLEK